MALVVENGTGIATADSYVSLVEMRDYWASRDDIVWSSIQKTDMNREASLRIATQWIDTTYQGRMQSTLLKSTQSLMFPRTEFCDTNGRTITGVPANLKIAVFEIAYLALSNPDFHTKASSTASGQIKRAKAGPAEVEYFEGGSSSSSNEFANKLSYVRKLLRPYMSAGSNQLVRA